MALLPMFNKKGQSLVELLMVIALAALLMPPIFMGYMSSRDGKAQQKKRLLATSLMKETQEETRNIRERGWSYLVPTGTYHPVLSGSSWSLIAGATGVNGFTQQVVVDDVYRNTSGTIVISPTPGVLDPSTKKISTTISWSTPRASTINHVTYMTRFRDNLPYTETTKAQFNNDPTHLSVFDKTAAVNTTESSLSDDGEVDMGLGGLSDWCNPSDTAVSYDLVRQGSPTSIAAIEGHIFTTTGNNSSGYPFTNVAVSDLNPPSEAGYFDGYKSYGVYTDPSSPSTAYIGTDKKGEEVVFIDLSQQTGQIYSKKGYFDADLSGALRTARSVFVVASVGDVVIDDKFYTFDITKSGKTKLAGPVSLFNNGTKIIVRSGYAFISNSGTSNQLEIFSVSGDGKTIGSPARVSLDGGGATDVAVNDTGTRAYVVTSAVSGKDNLFIINTENKASPFVIHSFNASGVDPKGVALVPNRVIVVGTDNGGKEYQVIKIDAADNPSYCNANIGLDINNGVYGIITVVQSSGSYAYIITGDSSAEIRIIAGGPGGSFGYNGTFTSAPFDTDGGFAHAFNRFTANVSVPSQTSISLQMAVANAGTNGCVNANYTFIGPDTTDYLNSHFQPVGSVISGQIPLVTFQNYINPGRCFKYKVYLNTPDSSRTPALLDMTINYSP